MCQGLQRGQLGVGQAEGSTRPSWSARGLIASPRIATAATSCLLASAPSFKWVKWRLKPVPVVHVHQQFSVILMRGSNWLVWSISACARSGTAASSGVIFSPDSVRMASGSSRCPWPRVTVANCSSSSCKRSSVYWSLFGLIAGGRALLALECGELLGRQQVVVEVALLQIVGGDKLIIPFC